MSRSATFALLVLLAAGCASDPEPAATQSASLEPTPQAERGIVSRLVGPSPRERLVGRWEGMDEAGTVMTITADGRASQTVPGLTLDATYRVLDDTTVQFDLGDGLLLQYAFGFEDSLLVTRQADRTTRWRPQR